jgi:uncharacterized protein YggE
MKQATLGLLVLLIGTTALSLNAQELEKASSTISVGATGHVNIPAEFAVLTLGVRVQDSTPTLAATALDNRISSVIDTLLTMGFPAESLPTSHYQVSPTWARNRVRIVGYDASSSIRVTIWDLTKVPAVIEASLTAGATDLNGLHFGATDERGARDEALRKAIAEARRDAEVIAASAGGEVGSLIEVSTQASGIRQARTMEMASVGGRGPQITPSSITVSANVNVRWAFVEN